MDELQGFYEEYSENNVVCIAMKQAVDAGLQLRPSDLDFLEIMADYCEKEDEFSSPKVESEEMIYPKELLDELSQVYTNEPPLHLNHRCIPMPFIPNEEEPEMSFIIQYEEEPETSLIIQYGPIQ